MFHRSAIALLALLLASPLTPAYAGEVDLDVCEARFAARPEERESALCFFDATKHGSPEDRAEAARRIEKLLLRNRESPWLVFYLGNLRWTEASRAEALYRTAAEGFAARGEAEGEYLARDNLGRVLELLGRSEEAAREIGRAVRIAEASKDPLLIARAGILQARYLQSQGKDLDRAYVLLRRVEPVALSQGTFELRRDFLLGLGNLSLGIGKVEEAQRAFQRLVDLALQENNRFLAATALYGLARSKMEDLSDMPQEKGRQEALTLARRALDAAMASGHRPVEAKASLLIGMLARGGEARASLEHCAANASSPEERGYCLSALASHLAAGDAARAEERIQEALRLGRETEDPVLTAFSWSERMRVSWATRPPEQAIADSLGALDVIEALREIQTGPTFQAGLLTLWSEDYYWLSGRLFASSRDGRDTRKVEQAFGVLERLRARTLLETLQAARVVPTPSADEVRLRTRRAAVLEDLAGVQRRLLDPDLSPQDRTAAVYELERMELEESDLRNQLARSNPALASLHRPTFANLARVRQALAPDEAMLSFQIAPWKDIRGEFAGGGWLLVLTRDATRVYRLPGRVELRPAVSLFTGLFERRDGEEAGIAARLHEILLGTALTELPPGIRRLVVVPDDALYRLPFAALRETPEAEPLAIRFQISVVPSATLWLRWKGERPLPSPLPALALADPPLPGSAADRRDGGAVERAAIFLSPGRLDPLPQARFEGRAVVRHLGAGSTLRTGDEASEDFLKRADPRRFTVLHFATHAVTDDVNPERSGILLAPGAATEDGLLQMREIVDLDLSGRIVVLASCRSGAGALLRGEGVVSLARAFFQAGAHTVVASFWPLRDDEAAALFDRFYHHLGRGRSVAEALGRAQRDRIEDGAPAAAWAGLVVHGDGDLVPLPGGGGSFRGRGRIVPALAVILLLPILMVLALRRAGVLPRGRG
ncbi:MAG TPA: CHAT domain-containing protein [Thermoanaerobaculia bacterium]|nr:CHAT domain-containing protein [Thermoanaerobaculia bacterium]